MTFGKRRSKRAVSLSQLVRLNRGRMNEDTAVARSQDRLCFDFADAAVKDIRRFCTQSSPVGFPVNLVPALRGFAAKSFHPLHLIASGGCQLEDECHPVPEFIRA